MRHSARDATRNNRVLKHVSKSRHAVPTAQQPSQRTARVSNVYLLNNNRSTIVPMGRSHFVLAVKVARFHRPSPRPMWELTCRIKIQDQALHTKVKGRWQSTAYSASTNLSSNNTQQLHVITQHKSVHNLTVRAATALLFRLVITMFLPIVMTALCF